MVNESPRSAVVLPAFLYHPSLHILRYSQGVNAIFIGHRREERISKRGTVSLFIHEVVRNPYLYSDTFN